MMFSLAFDIFQFANCRTSSGRNKHNVSRHPFGARRLVSAAAVVPVAVAAPSVGALDMIFDISFIQFVSFGNMLTKSKT